MPMGFTSGAAQTGLSSTAMGNPTAGAGVGEAGGQESSPGLSTCSITDLRQGGGWRRF